MSNEIRPLMEVLNEVPDPRTLRGRRYSLVSILSLVCLATLCGYKSYGAMAQWVEDYGPQWLERLKFTRGTAPSVDTLHSVLTRLDVQALERILGQWANSVLCAAPASKVIAIDGKRLHSAAKQGAPGAHLLSALSPMLGLTQREVARTIVEKGGTM